MVQFHILYIESLLFSNLLCVKKGTKNIAYFCAWNGFRSIHISWFLRSKFILINTYRRSCDDTVGDWCAPKYFTRASLPFHTRQKIFGAHEHRHDRAWIFYARIIALSYETNIFRLVWKGNDARVKYLGAHQSPTVSSQPL